MKRKSFFAKVVAQGTVRKGKIGKLSLKVTISYFYCGSCSRDGKRKLIGAVE